VAMGEDDRVYAFRSDSLCLQVQKKSAGIWAKAICTRIHQDPVTAGIYQ